MRFTKPTSKPPVFPPRSANEKQAACAEGNRRSESVSATGVIRLADKIREEGERRETFLSLRKRKACAAQTGTGDVGDNCGEHNCRHSQVHISSASTDVYTQLTDTRGPDIRTRADGSPMIKTRFHALLIPLTISVKTHDPRRQLWFGLFFFSHKKKPQILFCMLRG